MSDGETEFQPFRSVTKTFGTKLTRPSISFFEFL